MEDLKGKTAFITGGASGLGLAMAHAFGEAGMQIMLADIDQAALARPWRIWNPPDQGLKRHLRRGQSRRRSGRRPEDH